jgi:hypothetical protein
LDRRLVVTLIRDTAAEILAFSAETGIAMRGGDLL